MIRSFISRFFLVEKYFQYVFSFFITFLFFLLFIRFFIVSPGIVNGKSMYPTFNDDDFFVVNKISFLIDEPERFDIVQIIEPDQEKRLIKRIVGMPGETVTIRQGKVFLSSQEELSQMELDETLYLPEFTYTKVPGQLGPAEFVIPDGHYFVLGDNRSQSGDSRIYGPIPRNRVLGKVININ